MCPEFAAARQLHLHSPNRHRLPEQRILQFLNETGIAKHMMGVLEPHLDQLVETFPEDNAPELSINAMIPPTVHDAQS